MGHVSVSVQLLPWRLYPCQKMHTATTGGVICRLCVKVPESVAHVLACCTTLAQNTSMTRHNAALKILFFENLQDLALVETVPPWHSPVKPKPVYAIIWDVPLYVEHQAVRAHRVDARIINHETKQVITLEMSCPWITNTRRAKKTEEKSLKYGPLRWELKQQFQGNVVVVVIVVII